MWKEIGLIEESIKNCTMIETLQEVITSISLIKTGTLIVKEILAEETIITYLTVVCDDNLTKICLVLGNKKIIFF